MHYSSIKNNHKIIHKNDLLLFKNKQIQNALTLNHVKPFQKEHFLMESDNETNTTSGGEENAEADVETPDTNINTVLQENQECKETLDNDDPNNRFNVNKMMRLNKTYDAYKGSEVKVNNPPIAPYPFGWH